MTITELREAVERGEHPTIDEWKSIFPNTPDDDDYSRSMKAQSAALGWIDAAKALHEAALPGWNWAVAGHGLVILYPETGTPIKVRAGNVARAWLIAILKALEAQE